MRRPGADSPMTVFTIAQISDTHLSRTHGYFHDNWRALAAHLQQSSPDLVVHSGDLCFNAPDQPDDLAFARSELDALGLEWLALPGNHDVGEPDEEPRLGQRVNAQRLAAWAEHLGPDRFCHDLPGWRLIGLNSEVLGSGRDEEREQWSWLDETLSAAGTRSIGLFLHKPLFVRDRDEDRTGGTTVLKAARTRLLDRLTSHRVRFVACGHTHAYHRGRLGDIDLIWCPTSAMVDPGKTWGVPTTNRAGYLEWRFEDDRFEHRMIEPALIANIDLTNWTRQRGTTISLPARPVVSRSGLAR